MKSKSITLGGIFAAIYTVITIISVYAFPFLGVAGVFILPLFSAYFSCLFKSKEIIIFNIATLIVNFIAGVGDPFYILLYIFPSLLIGNVFGILNKLKTKYYTTIFLQTITYSITNILVLYLGQVFYEIDIIKFIIADEWLYNNFSLVILFVLSGAEAVLTSMIVNEKLILVHIIKEKEKCFPFYGYITILSLFLLAIIFFFISSNFYTLFLAMLITIIIGLFHEINDKIKHKKIIYIAFVLIMLTINFYMAYLNLSKLIPLIILSPFILYCLVKIIIYIYNINKSKKGKELG